MIARAALCLVGLAALTACQTTPSVSVPTGATCESLRSSFDGNVMAARTLVGRALARNPGYRPGSITSGFALPTFEDGENEELGRRLAKNDAFKRAYEQRSCPGSLRAPARLGLPDPFMIAVNGSAFVYR